MPSRKTAAKGPAAPRKREFPKPIYDGGFHASFPEIAHQLALLGATEEQMASALGVSRSAIQLWKTKHPEFGEQVRRGGMIADANVSKSLYQRAIGYSHDDVDIRSVAGEIVETPIKKHYPPEVVACIFWLKNRQPALWRDKIETGITDKDGKDVPPLDPVEAARRIAFVLAAGEHAMNAQEEEPRKVQ